MRRLTMDVSLGVVRGEGESEVGVGEGMRVRRERKRRVEVLVYDGDNKTVVVDNGTMRASSRLSQDGTCGRTCERTWGGGQFGSAALAHDVVVCAPLSCTTQSDCRQIERPIFTLTRSNLLYHSVVKNRSPSCRAPGHNIFYHPIPAIQPTGNPGQISSAANSA